MILSRTGIIQFLYYSWMTCYRKISSQTKILAGTVWMKFIAALVMSEGKMPENLPFASKVHLEFCFPDASEEEVLKRIQDSPSPRLLSSHAHLRFIEKQVMKDKVRVIVVMRNPKDTLVSLYHFYQIGKALGFYKGTWDEFFQLFKEKRLWGGDMFDFNTAWWKVRDQDNIFITTYEEMKKDHEGVVRKVAKFLGKELSDEVVQKIVELTGFEQMKSNPLVNGEGMAKSGLFDYSKSQFMRKGHVGDWKNYFTEDQAKYIQELCDQRYSPIGLSFEDTM